MRVNHNVLGQVTFVVSVAMVSAMGLLQARAAVYPEGSPSGLIREVSTSHERLISESQQPQQPKGRALVGKVLDETKAPLPGAAIRIKGVKGGASAKVDGSFTIAIPQGLKEVIVEVSYIGMEKRSVKYTGQEPFVIVLKEEKNELSEVVITGYQKLKKNSFTGNATIVTKKDLEQVNAKDAIKALEAFDPSFRILDDLGFGADPNKVHEVTLRGGTSIPKDRSLDMENERLTQRTNLRDNPNMPVFILDGFEVSVQKIFDLDMNRIQSITILKDAAATALHGSRAANGVVIVTTIPPKAGEIRVDYNSTLELTFPDLYDYNLTNAKEKLQVEVDAGLYSGVHDWDIAEKQRTYTERVNDIRRGVETDWLARPLRNAYNIRNFVGVSGGVNEIRYMLDFNYDNNAGVMKGSFRNRMGAGMMIDYRLRNWLQIQNRVSYSKSSYEDSPFGYFNDYSNFIPYEPIFDENGQYVRILKYGEKVNPLWAAANLHSYAGRGNIGDLVNNLSVNLNFNNNLSLKSTFSIGKVRTEVGSFEDPKSPAFDRSRKTEEKGRLNRSEDTRTKWNLKSLLHYNNQFGKHFFNLTAGLDIQETIDERLRYTLEGFSLGALNHPLYAANQPRKNDIYTSRNRLLGTLAALNYSFDEIYLLDASFRMDGSSQFGANKRFAPFASIGLGVNVHKYSFLRDNKYINALRLRGSYGNTGTVNFSKFDVVSSYIADKRSWYYTGPAIRLETMGNPNLTWELTKTLDVGLAIEMFNGKLYFEGNYYRKDTENIIEKIAIRRSSGFTTYNGNTGAILNEGFELKTNLTLFRNRDWAVVFNANMASNKNTITKLNPGIEEYNKSIKDNYDAENPKYPNLTNQTLTMYYVGASRTAIYAVPSLGIDPATGNEIFVKRDGSITKEWSAIDLAVVGDKAPKAQGSFGFNVAYKRFYLNTTFLYSYGGQMYNTTLRDKVENANIEKGNVDRRVISERWHRVGDVVPFYGITQKKEPRPTSRYVQDDNHVYFNSIVLGYDFGKKVTSALKLSAMSISFNASDIARWSTIKVERGLSYPYAHTYSVSLRLSY